MFTRIDHILVHKTHINKFKRTEIKPTVFSGYNGSKLEVSNRKVTRKIEYSRLQSMTQPFAINKKLGKNQWIKEEVMREIKIR
jgi:hypothetical protein